MMIKILLLFITLFLSFNLSVDAALCDKEYIDNLKELAGQVDVNYEYIDYSQEILSGKDGSYSTNRYIININLLNDELYVNYNDKKYEYTMSNDGRVALGVNSGNVELSIHSSRCGQYKLRHIALNLPRFNTYYYKNECRGLENKIDVCDKWYQGNLNDSTFENRINEYLNKKSEYIGIFDKIILFFKEDIMLIFSGLLLCCLVLFGIFSYKKRSILE